MIGFLLILLPYLAFLGLLAALVVVFLAFFWPEVEWRLLCWLQNRRRAREAHYLSQPKVTRFALRRPR